MAVGYITPAGGLSMADKETAKQWMVEGHSLMRGKVQGTVPARAAATITPGTGNQTIPAGVYLEGAQTIRGDGNLVPGNIRSGVSIFGVMGSLVTIAKTQGLIAPNSPNRFTGTLHVPGGTKQIVIIVSAMQFQDRQATRHIVMTDNFGRTQWDHSFFLTYDGATTVGKVIDNADGIATLSVVMDVSDWAKFTSFGATYIIY